MDNVLIVVDDLDAAKAFFAQLGMELEGETTVEGAWVDSTVGLENVRADITMMRTPDGHGRVELYIAQYEDHYRLCFLRGPEGIIIGLAEQLS